MHRTVVKIDLCGSKEFFDRHPTEANIRKQTLEKLTETVRSIYPDSEEQFPKGSLYDTQGDCVYIILEKPTVALRTTVEFMKSWYALTNQYPDARAVLDAGEIEVTDNASLVGQPFENISVVEKEYGRGQIAVTDIVIQTSDKTLLQYINKRYINVTADRRISTWLVNYENPRLLSDSGLVHALFIAAPSGAHVRDTAFEALLIEFLLERHNKPATIEEYNAWLVTRGCPKVAQLIIDVILRKSHYVEKRDEGTLALKDEASTRISSITEKFKKSKEQTLDEMIRGLAKHLGVYEELVKSKINVESLLEEYLCSVFLEIRFMANYFKSTETLFTRLSTTSEFDYILRNHLGQLVSQKPEQFLYIKTTFLNLLKSLAKPDNSYIASIFHNVLMLYYLNRNSKYVHSQLEKIKKKKIYLDTNVLYALRCKESPYYEMLQYAIERLRSINASICVFNKSVDEYNDSLNAAAKRYDNKYGLQFYYNYYRPWIWKEFESNPKKYQNSFAYCVALNRIPPSQERTAKSKEDTSKYLSDKMGIALEELEPYHSKDEIRDLYERVYNAKRIFNPITNWYETPGNEDTYQMKVLHDANCLDALKCPGNNPFDCSNLFVTCDYRLSKIRHAAPNQYEFLVTITEFYEFIMPYLFLSDVLTSNPSELPNFLLASAIAVDLANTMDFESIVGKYLTNDHIDQNYEILSSIKNTERFEDIKKKYKHLADTDVDAITESQFKETIIDAASAIAEYRDAVKQRVAKSLAQKHLEDNGNKIIELEKKNQELAAQLERYRIKEEKRIKYKKKEARKKKSSSQVKK